MLKTVPAIQDVTECFSVSLLVWNKPAVQTRFTAVGLVSEMSTGVGPESVSAAVAACVLGLFRYLKDNGLLTRERAPGTNGPQVNAARKAPPAHSGAAACPTDRPGAPRDLSAGSLPH